MFHFQWLRLFVRRYTKPIEEHKALIWKKRLSIIYALTAWNAFGFVMYMMFTGKSDWARFHGLKSAEELALTPAQQWTKTLGIKDATVYRVSGFKVSKYEVHNEFDEKDRKLPQIKFMQSNEAEETKVNGNT